MKDALNRSVRMRNCLIIGLLAAALAVFAGEESSAKNTVSKKGLAGHVSGEKLKELKVGWFYYWTPRVPTDIPAGIEFVPMVWGLKDDPALDSTMAGLVEKKKAGTFSTVLGFNEPDGKDQSNMTVEVALEKWPKLMETGLRLGSPAVVH